VDCAGACDVWEDMSKLQTNGEQKKTAITSQSGASGSSTITEGSPLRELLVIAAPSVATMTSYTAMQFIDALMVSRIEPADPVYVAAQGNGGVMAFLPISIAMGFVGMVNSFVSQHLGAGQPRNAPAYVWTAMWLGLIWSILLIPYALALPAIFELQGHGERLIELESSYAQILVMGACVSIAAKAFSQFFFGLHRPWVVLIAAMFGNVVNVLFNYLLIYGNSELGIPALGVAGAAWGTVLGTVAELLVPLCVFLGPKLNKELGTRGAWRFSEARARELFSTGWAPALMIGSEMICWAIFMSSLVGQFGVEQNSASWIALRYMHMSFMPAVGISFAITAVVGKAMGAGRPDLARQRAWMGIKLAMGWMTFCAVMMLAFREPLVGLLINADEDPEVAARIISLGMKLMVVAAAFQLFDALGICIVGALRGAGDTVVPGVVTLILAWSLIVGLGWGFARFMPQWQAMGPWIAAGLYITAFGLFALLRFQQGKWEKIQLIKKDELVDVPQSHL
jgi:multidrug resistance protein, MATE family